MPLLGDDSSGGDLRLQPAESASPGLPAFVGHGGVSGLVIFDRSWRYVYASAGAAVLLGVAPEGLAGRSLNDTSPALVETALGRRLKKAMEDRVETVFQEYYPPLSRWYMCSAFPSPDGLTVQFSDVTEQHEAQAALRENEERYRALFANMTEGFAVGEPLLNEAGAAHDFAFLEINDAFRDQTGLGDEVLNQPVTRVLPQLESHWIETYCRVAQTGEPTEFTNYNKDTDRHYHVYCYQPAENRFAILFRDVTEEKKTQEALAASEQWFRTLANAMPQLVWTAESDGRVDYYNDRYKHYKGIEQTEDGCFAWQPVLHEEDRAPTLQAWENSVRTGQMYQIEHRVQRRDGRYHWHLSRGLPVRDSDGNIVKWFGTATDIDDLKRAEEAVRSLALFPEQNSLPVLRVARDGELLYANKASADLRANWRCQVGETVPEEIIARVQRTLDEKTNCDMEVRADDRIFSFAIVPIAESGYVNLYGRDETERKRAQEALRQRAEEIERLLEVVPAAVWVAHDPQCLNITGNRRANEFYEAEAGENVSATASPESRLFFDAAGRQLSPEELPMQVAAAENCDVQGEELYVQMPSGRRIAMLGNATPLRDESGRVRGCIGAFINITARKQVEDALRQSESFYRQTLESIPGMVFTTRPDGYCDYQSEQWVEYTGVPMSEHLGDGWNRLLHPDDQPRALDAWHAAVKGRAPYDLEYRVRRHDGEYGWFKVVARPIHDVEGKVVRWFGVALNIDDMKKVEEALQVTAENLKRSNDDLEQFAYVASHDLQEPLRMVSSFLGLLRERHEQELNPTAREFIGFAVDGAIRMSLLIRDLLEFSRVGTHGKAFAPISAAEAARKAVVNCSASIEETGAKIELGELPTVWADQTQLVQLFQNLITNAIKFRRDGVVPHVAIHAEQKERHWLFRVSDNGIGIEAEHSERIFMIFQRLHTRDKYEGTGIGLALCKKIVERHGGRIWLESTPGRGSIFGFTLPMSEVDKEESR